MENSKGRIYNEVRSIESTLDFWQSRAARADELGALNVTMLQDGDQELAGARDAHEKATLLRYLAPTDGKRVLDIGCGVGRWAHDLIGSVDRYMGVDFSDQLIALGRHELAGRYEQDGWRLEVLSATQLDHPIVVESGPFDRFLISGLFLYMNDDEVRTCFEQMAACAGDDARIVLKDSLALSERLTLDEFESDKLGTYSAVYRTAAFYEQITREVLEPAGFGMTANSPLYPEHLTNRAETEQHFWVWER